jgi:hypothetical protein
MALDKSPKGVSGKKIKLSRGVSYYEVDRRILLRGQRLSLRGDFTLMSVPLNQGGHASFKAS